LFERKREQELVVGSIQKKVFDKIIRRWMFFL